MIKIYFILFFQTIALKRSIIKRNLGWKSLNMVANKISPKEKGKRDDLKAKLKKLSP